MTRTREPGYTPFADAPPLEDEEPPLPLSIPADELQRLNQTQHTEPSMQADAAPSALTHMLRFVWQGGSPGDAWLHMTAAQVRILSGADCLHAHGAAERDHRNVIAPCSVL